jgi:Zn-dependent protease with chaperone function
MNPAATLLLALLAAYGLVSLALSALVTIAWRAGLAQRCQRPDELLALRLLPSAGALLIVLTVVLPAFVRYEPPQETENVGLLTAALAAGAAMLLGAGIGRGWRAWRSTRRLLRGAARRERRIDGDGRRIDIVETAAPIVAVVGTWRPCIMAARSVLRACDADEFRQVLAHEAAHVAAGDNLKLLLLVACPDVLAWLPVGTAIAARWRIATEYAADERAAGADARRRVDLASALVKVARLTARAPVPQPALSLSVAADDVEGRVRRLLAPPRGETKSYVLRRALLAALCVPVAGVPLYATVHHALETLIALGS